MALAAAHSEVGTLTLTLAMACMPGAQENGSPDITTDADGMYPTIGLMYSHIVCTQHLGITHGMHTWVQVLATKPTTACCFQERPAPKRGVETGIDSTKRLTTPQTKPKLNFALCTSM